MNNSKAIEILEWYLEHENLSMAEEDAFQAAIKALEGLTQANIIDKEKGGNSK